MLPRCGAERVAKLALIIWKDPLTKLNAGMDNSEQFPKVRLPVVDNRLGRLTLIFGALNETLRAPALACRSSTVDMYLLLLI